MVKGFPTEELSIVPFALGQWALAASQDSSVTNVKPSVIKQYR
jgi:hypothetical protein